MSHTVTTERWVDYHNICKGFYIPYHLKRADGLLVKNEKTPPKPKVVPTKNLRTLWVIGTPTFQWQIMPPALRRLVVDKNPIFSGLGLPETLEILEVEACSSFDGTQLPPGLRKLRIVNQPGFTGANLPKSLEELWVVGCSGFLPKYAPSGCRVFEIAA